MNCPDIEEIIRFASVTPTESDAELAAHICNCNDCCENLHTALEAGSCDYQPTKIELMQVHNIVSARLKKQDKLQEIIKWISEKLSSCAVISLTSGAVPFGNAGQKIAFAGPQNKTAANVSAPEVCFSSDVSQASPYYWKAMLRFPAVMTNSSTLDFFVYTANNSPLPSGVLCFRGIYLPVHDGHTVISVEDFKKSISGQGISISFPDKYISHGDIRLQ